MSNGDMPAMPCEDAWESNGRHYGLTKREYFAAMALQGLNAYSGADQDLNPFLAVKQANALLAELEKGE